MFRNEMPRVYELRDLIDDPLSPCAYFQNFDTSICDDDPSKKQTWLAREEAFQKLDLESWSFLKSEAFPYLTAQDPNGRGWEQLISILNQAYAYNYLVDQGCLVVRFIPRADKAGQETPDLCGVYKGRKVLCEVKTMQVSENEATCRQAQQGRVITNILSGGFLNKLHHDLCKAKKQLASYASAEDTKRIVFLIINFDDALGEYKAGYYAQIDQYLATASFPDIDIVLYNQWTPFHAKMSMKHAIVVNAAMLLP